MARSLIGLPAILAVCLLAWGCSDRSSGTSLTAGYCITGTVTGDIISGVTLTLGGDSAAVTATNGSGFYQFSGLADGNYTLTPSRSACTFLPASINLVVNGADITGQDFTSAFTGTTFVISAAAGPGGTIDPAGTVSVNQGDSRTFTFTPDAGYVIEAVMADDVMVGTAVTYTFADVQADHAIDVFFKRTGAGADDDAVAGTFSPGLPTAECIGLRWAIGGDVNADAVVHLACRVAGQTAWQPAMDLRRVSRAYMTVSLQPPAGYVLFAGSIFGLAPDTEYEVRADLVDPDGGFTREIVSVHTWTEPQAAPPLRTLHVVPGIGGGSGTAGDPFLGIESANASAQPGDEILLHDGTYSWWNTLSADGTAEHPIVWKAAPGENPVIDGQNSFWVGISIQNAHHVMVEDLTIRRSNHGITIGGSSFITLRRLTITEGEYFIHAGNTGNSRLWISDCEITGAFVWPPGTQSGELRGIQISGEGNVICHNRITGVRDAIDTVNNPPVRDIDICDNEIAVCIDDGIELDYSDCNVRVFRNRLTNVSQGISFQPIFGGPCYAVRNCLYNVIGEALKLHAGSGYETAGAVILHNTIVKNQYGLTAWAAAETFHDVLILNNLFVFNTSPYAIEILSPWTASFTDHDVFCGPASRFGKLDDIRYDTIGEFAAGTGWETAGVHAAVSAGVFANGVLPPVDPLVEYSIAGCNDLRPASGSPAVDTAADLPTLNDAYAGSAPDAGAFEEGDPLPDYGPR